MTVHPYISIQMKRNNLARRNCSKTNIKAALRYSQSAILNLIEINKLCQELAL